MSTFIDKSKIMELATELLMAIDGVHAGYVIVPPGQPDPTDADVTIRLQSCNLKKWKRQSTDEADVADVALVVGVIVSETKSATDAAALDGAMSIVEQAMAMSVKEHAGTSHVLHIDGAEQQEGIVPDEQKQLRAGIVTMLGWCKRDAGNSIAHS